MSGPENEVRGFLVERKWREADLYVERLNARASDDPESFVPSPGSVLSYDDMMSTPFRVSVTLKTCLDTGTDHLHALKSLVRDAGLLHLAAPFSLARGALENFAAAAWILTADDTAGRVERVLRWQAKNLADSQRATGHLDPSTVPSAQRWVALNAVADRNNLGRKYRSGYTSTTAVKAAQAAFPDLSFGVLFPWQLCSGFAHGRPWATHGASVQERFDDEDPETMTLKLSSTSATVLYPTVAGVELAEAFMRLYDERAGQTVR